MGLRALWERCDAAVRCAQGEWLTATATVHGWPCGGAAAALSVSQACTAFVFCSCGVEEEDAALLGLKGR